jgi:hypothetical protein
MVFQMLLYGECYKNVYTYMCTNYPSFKMDSLYNFKYKRLRNTRHIVTFGIPLQSSF